MIKDPDQILNKQTAFYTELYTSDPEIEFHMYNDRKDELYVHEADRIIQGVDITLQEVQKVVKAMNNNKTPGPDGIPVDFYKVFWQKIHPHLMRMLTASMDMEKMPSSSMKGILNLIPKPGKDPRVLNNLRPITLLNVDYKIMEKIISNRMIESLKYLINGDQTGFMEGRRISANIRKILDVMQIMEDQDDPALVLSIDYQKVFDKIEIHSKRLINWIETLYRSFTLKIQNNGYMSESINVTRGIHQGGCCSTALFLVVAELLAIDIRKNKEIQGIPVGEITNLLGQYADDTDMTLKFCSKTVNEVLTTMERFRKNTGCSINYDKTKMYCIGSLKNSSAKLVYAKRSRLDE